MSLRWRVLLACLLATGSASADQGAFQLTPPSVGDVPVRRGDGLRIESVDTAFTAYQQMGYGYQSKAGPTLTSPGSQRLTVFEPQVLVVARSSARVTHRFWVPIDIVTAASPNANDKGRPPDMLSNASKQNESITFDWTTTYDAPKRYGGFVHNAVHLEENFRSWSTGLGGTFSFADDNSTIAANANAIFDWFQRYDAVGIKIGRNSRSTTNGNVGFTQILSPTTIAHVNYGLSAQFGQMSNTWNTVVFPSGMRDLERMPSTRTRHAVVARFAQWLPWNGTVKGFYRFYADSWGLDAHAVEMQLLQRVLPWLVVRGEYRFYRQTGVSFFTVLQHAGSARYTSDSDLARFDAQTAGLRLVADVPSVFQGLHIDAGFERYWRTDGLYVNMGLWQAGARF